MSIRHWIVGLGTVLWCVGVGAQTPSQCSDFYSFKPEPAKNYIVLAIDASGSMAGAPFLHAQQGALKFIAQMRPTDEAAVLAFGSEVRMVQELTGDKERLRRAIGKMRPRGKTRLYDALAYSSQHVMPRQGGRIVVLLTDGQDTGSTFGLDDISTSFNATAVQKLGVSEGLFIYGIGFGAVNFDALARLSRDTGGAFELADQSPQFVDLYPRILNYHYQQYGDRLSKTGTLAVRSVPDGKDVLVQARTTGQTPVKRSALTPDTYRIRVVFEEGVWDCGVPVKAGFRTVVDARAEDLGADLVITSSPPNASVYLDGAYVGTTALERLPVPPGQDGWVDAARNSSTQLRARKIPFGVHRLKFRAVPDFEFGPVQEFEVELTVLKDQTVVYVEIMGTGRSPFVLDSTGRAKLHVKRRDPFDF